MKRIGTVLERARIDAMSFVGLFAIAFVLAVIMGSYVGVLRALFGPDTERVTATFVDTATLREGDMVRVKGVDVGTVERITPVRGGRATRVEMELEDKVGEVHGDARAAVSWKSLLGGTFIVNLSPGRADGGRLPASGIPVERTRTQVELDDITTVIRGDARKGLRRIPPELADAMANPRTLPTLARTLDDASPSLERGLDAARGINKDRDLRTLVSETAKVTEALDAPGDQLRTLVSSAGGTLQTTAAREADLRTTIARAPGDLDDTERTVRRLDTTLGLARPLLSDLRGSAGEVAPTLARLRPTVERADRLLRDARPLLGGLRPAATSLAQAARDGLPLLDELDPSLKRLDADVLPYVNETDPQTTHTMAEMVGPGLGGLANVAAPFDANGHILRFPFSGGSSPTYFGCQSYVNNPDKPAIADCKQLEKLLADYLEYSPLQPEPQATPTPSPEPRSTEAKP